MRIVIQGDRALVDRHTYRLVRRQVKALLPGEAGRDARAEITLRARSRAVRCDFELHLAGRAALRTAADGPDAGSALAAALRNLAAWFGVAAPWPTGSPGGDALPD